VQVFHCFVTDYYLLQNWQIFTARRYANVVCALALCLCLFVCPSQLGVLQKR